MENNKLNTRIILRNDAISAWEDPTSIALYKGEVALALLSGNQSGNYSVRIGVSGQNWNQLSDVGHLIVPSADVDDLSDALDEAIIKSNNYTNSVSNELSTTFGGELAVEVQARNDAISAAISTLSKTDAEVANLFVIAVSETSGIISVSRSALASADIPTLEYDALGAASGVKFEVIGSAEDLSTANTIYGAKKYTDAFVDNFVELSAVKGGKSVLTETNKLVTQSDVQALTGVMHFKGVATNDVLSTGSTLVPVPPYSSSEDTPISGDFIIDKVGSEFVWAISADDAIPCWYKVGDETLYAKKSDLDSEIKTRTDDDNYLSAKIDSLSGSISSIALNGCDFTTSEGKAILSIDWIDCGNAF